MLKMFGHLDAKDFIKLSDGMAVSSKCRVHLETCARCLDSLVSLQAARLEIPKTAEEGIPDPDWSEFRTNVRDALLSRSVRRETKAGGWAILPQRSVMAWVVSIAFLAGVSGGVLIVNPRMTGQDPMRAVHHQSEAHRFQGASVPASAPRSPQSTILKEPVPAARLKAEIGHHGGDNELATLTESNVVDDLAQLDEQQTERFKRLLEASPFRISPKE